MKSPGKYWLLGFSEVGGQPFPEGYVEISKVAEGEIIIYSLSCSSMS
jgi:hypothetical protein